MITQTQEAYTAFRATSLCNPLPKRQALDSLKPENIFHQWPLRGLAFASDLGTVAKLVNLPKIGIAGWVIAVPYYLASIFSKDDRQQRQKELIYQTTANGVFPFLEAKAGVHLAGKLSQNKSIQAFLPILLKQKPQYLQLLSGLLFVALLTPLIGDPLSKKCVSWLGHSTLNSDATKQKKWEA
jgi:hypothetical protein